MAGIWTNGDRDRGTAMVNYEKIKIYRTFDFLWIDITSSST